MENIDKQTIKTPTLLTENTKGSCTAKQWKRGWPKYTTFTRLIDHGISNLSPEAITVTQQVFEQSDVKKYQLTDHCPILFSYQ